MSAELRVAIAGYGPAGEVFHAPLVAEIDVRRPSARVDDDAFVALEHPDGVRSHLRMSAIAPVGGRSLRASGTSAGVETPGLDPQEDQLAAGLRPGDAGWGVGEPARFVDCGGERLLALEAGAYERFYAGVRDALRDGTQMPVDPRDSVHALRVVELAQRASRNRHRRDSAAGVMTNQGRPAMRVLAPQ